jgi:hypothetical protein
VFNKNIGGILVVLGDLSQHLIVETLDKKLAGFEVILKERVVSREQFFRFSKDVETRLTRIGQYLTDQSREHIGKP